MWELNLTVTWSSVRFISSIKRNPFRGAKFFRKFRLKTSPCKFNTETSCGVMIM